MDWYGITCHGMRSHAAAYSHKFFSSDRSLRNILCLALINRYILRSAGFCSGRSNDTPEWEKCVTAHSDAK